MRNDTKRKFGTMFFVACIVFFGHWWDYFYMIKPGARTAAHEAKEIAEGKHHGAKPTDTSISEAIQQPKSEETVTHHVVNDAVSEGHTTGHEAAGEAQLIETNATHETHDTPASNAETKEAGETPVGATHAKAEHREAKHAAENSAHEESKSFKLGYTLPGLDDIGVMIGFLSLFLFFFFNQLSRASLVPMRDPYLEESLHHDTGALIETEGEGDGHH